MAVKIIICIVVGYFCGTISTGYLIGRMHHIDIRNYGSGNAGATNAVRTLGKKAGFLVMLGDILKVVIPAVLVRYVIFRGEDYGPMLCEIIGLAAVLGHNYPFWLKFKGGKGIASTAGAMVSTDVRFFLFVPVFVLIVAITKYVSVGSLFVVFLYPIFLAFAWYGEPYYLPMILIACLFTVSGVFTHRANIKRLLNGTERKFGQKVAVTNQSEDQTKEEEA